MYQIALAPDDEMQLQVSLLVSDRQRERSQSRQPLAATEQMRVRSDNELFNRILDRSLGDLAMFRSGSGNAEYFAAGIPWYVALFGRDSIITALQMLAYDPEIAEQTIRLARTSSRKGNQ